MPPVSCRTEGPQPSSSPRTVEVSPAPERRDGALPLAVLVAFRERRLVVALTETGVIPQVRSIQISDPPQQRLASALSTSTSIRGRTLSWIAPAVASRMSTVRRKASRTSFAGSGSGPLPPTRILPSPPVHVVRFCSLVAATAQIPAGLRGAVTVAICPGLRGCPVTPARGGVMSQDYEVGPDASRIPGRRFHPPSQAL